MRQTASIPDPYREPFAKFLNNEVTNTHPANKTVFRFSPCELSRILYTGSKGIEYIRSTVKPD